MEDTFYVGGIAFLRNPHPLRFDGYEGALMLTDDRISLGRDQAEPLRPRNDKQMNRQQRRQLQRDRTIARRRDRQSVRRAKEGADRQGDWRPFWR